jgi:hypothetical protein
MATQKLTMASLEAQIKTLAAELAELRATTKAQASAKTSAHRETHANVDRTPADLDAFCARYVPALVSRYEWDKKEPLTDGMPPRWITYIEKVYADRGFTTAERLYSALDKALGRNLYSQLSAIHRPEKLPPFLARLYAEIKNYEKVSAEMKAEHDAKPSPTEVEIDNSEVPF